MSAFDRHRGFRLLCCAAALSLCAGQTEAADWTLKGGDPIPGELSSFDFGEKRAVFEKPDGGSHAVPSEELSADSRWRLLISPQFARSFPPDRWTSEQGRYIMTAIAVPVLCLLVSFYVCALIIFKSCNPFRALAGWFGSALLGGFLMGFYLVLSARSPASATGILLMGVVISAALLSVYVSIIYHTTAMDGLKVLILHVCGAFFFLMLTVLAARKATQTFDFESFIKTEIMIPVGLLPKE
jgi:hypothetical protein